METKTINLLRTGFRITLIFKIKGKLLDDWLMQHPTFFYYYYYFELCTLATKAMLLILPFDVRLRCCASHHTIDINR